MSRRRQSRHTKTYKILFILFEYGLNSEKQNCGWIFRFSINRFYYRVSVVLLHASLFTNVPSSAVGTLARNYRQRAGWVLDCSRHLNGFQFQFKFQLLHCHPFHLTPPHPTSKKCRNHWLYGSWCAVWLSSLFHCGLDPSCSIHSVWKIPKEFWIRHKNSKFWLYWQYWQCWNHELSVID